MTSKRLDALQAVTFAAVVDLVKARIAIENAETSEQKKFAAGLKRSADVRWLEILDKIKHELKSER